MMDLSDHREGRRNMTARVRVSYVANRLCVRPRTVQDMAARGQIPGAARIGKLWTFDPIKLERFITAKEGECQQNENRISTSAKVFGGSERLSTAGNTERAFTRAMSEMLGNGGTSGLRKSKARRGSAFTGSHGTRP